MEQMQLEIAAEAVFQDRVSFDSLDGKTVVGIDQAFLEDEAISATVAIKDGEVLEKVYGKTELEMPYIPGLLAFREASSVIKALEKLEVNPDILFLDGSGRIHFREAGIATHIGVLFDVPAIGIAKNLLCGEPETDLEGLKQGQKVSILADDSIETEIEKCERIGYAFQSRQYENSSRKINPLYISSGHKVDAERAVEFVAETCYDYKLPEPVRLADKHVDQIKRQLQ